MGWILDYAGSLKGLTSSELDQLETKVIRSMENRDLTEPKYGRRPVRLYLIRKELEKREAHVWSPKGS